MNLEVAVREATGRDVRWVERVGGGDINEAYRVQFFDESFAFVKTRADVAPGEYAAEAAGLEWLAAAGGLRVPEVLGVADGVLVLDWVDEGARGDAAAFGAGLAAVHAAGAEAFGAPPAPRGAASRPGSDSPPAPPGAASRPGTDSPPAPRGAASRSGTDSPPASRGAASRPGTDSPPAPRGAASRPGTDSPPAPAPVAPLRLGPLTLPNEPTADWPTFYAERRLLPLLSHAGLTRFGNRAVESVCARIEELAGPPEPPARLHGDLWSGNVLWGRDGRAWLIDPAAYGGHREVDLAMLRLFGEPGKTFLPAYEERLPLAPGHEERVALYQLFPLLVHAALFGGGYPASAERVARSYA